MRQRSGVFELDNQSFRDNHSEDYLSEIARSEADVLQFLRNLLSNWWIICSFTLFFSGASVFYALSLPDMYNSTTVLARAEGNELGGLAGLAGNIGGLASLAGVNIGPDGSNKAAEALEIVQSWAFIEEFIEEQDIAPEVFAVNDWDKETNELVYDASVYDVKNRLWIREPSENKSSVPSSWELYQAFLDYLHVEEDNANGFISVKVDYYSPDYSKRWVDAIVDKINTKLRIRDSNEAEKNIQFLKDQIEQTSVASMHSVFYGLIEEQTKTLMLAKGSSEYVFKTVSEARVAEVKSKPKRAIICLLGATLGCLLGCLVSIVRGNRKMDAQNV